MIEPANDDVRGPRVETDDIVMRETLFASIIAAQAICATFHAPIDWQRFYDREGGPVRFGVKLFRLMKAPDDLHEPAISLFVSTFLEELRDAEVVVRHHGAPLIGNGLLGE